MKQRTILLLLMLLVALGSQAQKLTVESFAVAPGDLDARSSETRRTDRNGTPCALVKVQLPLQGAVFDGVVGDVQFRAGTYWVYLPDGAYLMSISHPQYHKLDLNLRTLRPAAEYFRGVEQLTTYNLIINVPGQKEERKQKLVINYTPTHATVLIDSKLYRGNGSVEADLPLGEHMYVVAADGYVTEEGMVKLNGGNQRVLPVPLEKEMAANSTSLDNPIASGSTQEVYQIEPSAYVTADLTHILYAGYNNPISITTSGIPLHKISAKTSNGTITANGTGKYIVHPAKEGQDAIITLSTTDTERPQTIGTFTFSVQKLPDPTPYIDIKDNQGNPLRFKGGNLSKGILMDAEFLSAAINEGNLKIDFRVQSFVTMFFDNLGIARPLASDGNRFSDEQRSQFRKLTRGRRFYISNIIVTGPDGIERTLPTAMEIKVN